MKKAQIPAISMLAVLVLLIGMGVGACGGGEVTPPPEPAEFEVISLDIEPSEVVAGETTNITAVVENIGGSEGTYAAVLIVDGVTEEAKEVVITAGSSKVVTFSLVKDTPGTYEIGVGGLSSSLVVAEPIPVVPEPVPGEISDPEGDVAFGFIDIVSVKVTVEGEEVVAQIELSELPEKLMFNQAPENLLEYEWGIYFDIDGDLSTGSTFEVGADYALSVQHFVFGEAEEDSILGACQITAWKLEGTSITLQSWATAETDYATNTLTIRGTVPGLNTDSRWFARAYYWDTALGRSSNDRAPDTDFALLAEE
jgi:hypothetical protein